MSGALTLANGSCAPLDAVPVLDAASFRAAVLGAVGRGERLAALFGAPPEADGATPVYAVLAADAVGTLGLLATRLAGAYPALTPDCPQAHLFERELAEQWGLRPEGHPWLKPVRALPGGDAWAAGGPGAGFFAIAGAEIHEVAVGPVHAGIIEPGHFRFQCHGETVHHLEIALGYQHRGIERALRGGPGPRTVHYVEAAAGDTTIGHALAYAGVMEALAGTAVSSRAEAIRGIALELERLANHIGDLGALAGDVGFLPTQSFCGRIRGDVLNLTALLCGNRFGRGLVRPGGAACDADAALRDELLARLEAVARDAAGAIELLWETPSVLSRFEGTGALSAAQAHELGLVGIAARACGLDRDARHDFADGVFRFAYIPVSTWATGDVFARAFVRWLETQRSLAFVRSQLEQLPDGPAAAPVGAPAPRRIAVALAEAWRGEVCHVAITDDAGRFAAYKIVDPSFHNWFGLALALRGQAISDFPLCNKSFNLSYCGHDL